MQRDFEALEIVCRHYDALYSTDALRAEKNRVRRLQRRIVKLEAELGIAKSANVRWKLACQQWSESYRDVQQRVRGLDAALRSQLWN